MSPRPNPQIQGGLVVELNELVERASAQAKTAPLANSAPADDYRGMLDPAAKRALSERLQAGKRARKREREPAASGPGPGPALSDWRSDFAFRAAADISDVVRVLACAPDELEPAVLQMVQQRIHDLACGVCSALRGDTSADALRAELYPSEILPGVGAKGVGRA